MWRSCLLIDVGNNPDRPRPGRLWLRNLYHVHQRLCMAFPSDARKERDTEFLAPYAPEDFPEQRHLADKKTEVDPEILEEVHSPRCTDRGFLFRIDPEERCCGNSDAPSSGRVVILVQSASKPNWDYAFGLKQGLRDERGRPVGNAAYLLAAPPEEKLFEPTYNVEQRLRFRLLANPTRKVDTKTRPDGTKSNGRRIPVPPASEIVDWREAHPDGDVSTFICGRLLDWLADRAADSGFSVDKNKTTVSPGYLYFKKPGKDSIRMRSVRFDGVLTITDATRFGGALMRGIGPGKGFGFGLLSVAPYHAPLAAEAE